jgi:site-specific DNA recombinase
MHVRNQHGALLKGLIHCGPCGHAMGHTYSVKDGKAAYRYYVCYVAQKQGWHACPSGSLPAEQIERLVVDRIKHIGGDAALVNIVNGSGQLVTDREGQHCEQARDPED